METSAPGWLFRRIVEEMPEAVIFADREGVVRRWNRGAETMFGYSAAAQLSSGPSPGEGSRKKARRTT